MDLYEITQGNQVIGQACVQRQGLYYQINCRCRLSGEVICRIVVTCGGKQENLGIPVPEKDAYTLHTRISVSRLGEGGMSFRAVPRHNALEGKFVPLSPEEPFQYLSRLKNARLESRNGVVGIVLEE